MKGLEIVRFELRQQLRRRSNWFYLSAVLVLVYLTHGSLVSEATRDGTLEANAPFAIAAATTIIAMLSVVIIAALFGEAATRDAQARTEALFYTTPVPPWQYVAGRFFGVFVVAALILAAVPLGLIISVPLSGVSADLLGPFRLDAYLQPYLAIALPTVFATSAVLFSLAALTRRAMVSWLGATLLFIMSLVSEELLAESGRTLLGALLDPFGFAAGSEASAGATTFERNTQLVPLDGGLLWNRLLWMVIGIAALATTCVRFRFAHADERSWLRRRRPAVDPQPDRPHATAAPPAPLPATERAFGAATKLRQMLAIAVAGARGIVLRREFAFVAVVLAAAVVLVGQAVLADSFGSPYLGVTSVVAPFVGSGVISIAIVALTAFYAGDLVWREREARIDGLTDATPIRDWAPFSGKLLALLIVLVALQGIVFGAGMLLQALLGWHDFDLALWVQIVFGIQLVDHVLLAVLALLIHVLIDQKYVAHVVVLFFYVFTRFAGRLGIEQHLLVYTADPGWVYSDLSGYGPFLGPWFLYKLYWAAWALLFAAITRVLWVRGEEIGQLRRLLRSRHNVSRATTAVAATALLLVAVLGGVIFYNTDVVADQGTAEEEAERWAQYERRYGRYAGVPQPQVTGTTLHIELYPADGRATVRGTYRLVNRTGEAIDSVHVFIPPEVDARSVRFDRDAREALADVRLGHRIYVPDRPVEPGDSVRLTFDIAFDPRGFPRGETGTVVVSSGTYFDHVGGRQPNHRRWMPLIGFQEGRMLRNDQLRRRHGLEPLRAADAAQATAARTPGREWSELEIVIGTDSGQTALAPGALQRTWTEQGRSYFHYAVERPVRNGYAILSGRYARTARRWNGVEIEMFHHPGHTWNVERLMHSAQATLDYASANYGPYPHPQLRIAEFPKYARMGHAYPGMVVLGEGIGFLASPDTAQDFDTPFAVMAHEVAHQWWGMQVAPADAQGAAVLSEILAQYTAMMVLDRTHGPEHLARFLRTQRVEYLNDRGGGGIHEVPLLEMTGQPYLAYEKGALTMFTLREYVGEDSVNAALRRFLNDHRFAGPPYPTARDLYRELRASTPDSLHALLGDLFERVTLWSLHVDAAEAVPVANGEWRVTMEVTAGKVEADTIGKETAVPVDELVELGVFGPVGSGDGAGEPLYLARHRLRSGRQTITVTVPGEPARAVADPRNLLLDREIDDHGVPVTRLPSRNGDPPPDDRPHPGS